MPGLRNIEEYMDLIKDLGVEVYKDAARPAVSEVGAVAGRTVKALLAPIRGFLWCWEKIEDYVEKEVQKRLEKVPEERLKSPDPEIAVPLLQSLTYTAQNETLREMYIALLANSMDISKENVVHPSYVDIIKKMNRLDALLFEKLSKTRGYVMAINPRIAINGTNKIYTNALPEWYLGWTIDGYDEFAVSASLIRMSKFGILELMYDRTITEANYSALRQTTFLEQVPNCAWSESAAAGALGVQLGGDHEYFGKTVHKPTIGDDIRPPEGADIRRINRLMFAAAGMMLALIAGIALLISYCIQ